MQYLTLLLFAPFFIGAAQPVKNSINPVSPLSDFSEEWNDPKYEACNTAANAGYMNDDEKNVIYILNCVRTNPRLFCSTVVKQYPQYTDNAELINITYYQSLVTTLNLAKKQGLLQPDENCFTSAACHAYNSGIEGTDGHDRSDSCNSKLYYNGECCDYGHADPLDIVMSLLIDYAVPSRVTARSAWVIIKPSAFPYSLTKPTIRIRCWISTSELAIEYADNIVKPLCFSGNQFVLICVICG